MYIDYSRIVVEDFTKYIDAEKLAELKEIARKEKTYLTNRYNPNTLRGIVDRKAWEIVTINARHQLRNDLEKSIIANNIVFDNQKFASILNSGSFDLESLETFVKIVRYIKTRLANGDFDDKDQKYVRIADSFALKLANHFKKYIGISDQNLIINKINEVISYEPELIVSKKSDHSRK